MSAPMAKFDFDFTMPIEQYGKLCSSEGLTTC